MNTIKISRPIVVLQAGDPEKSVYTQHDKENQETGCPDRRATGIIKTRLSEFLRRVLLCLFICRAFRIKEAACQTGKSASESLQ